MKSNRFFQLLLLCFLSGSTLLAQTDPGTTSLKHQWTFDNGTAVDHIGNLTGTIVGNGALVNKGFNTSGNAYMSFPAAEIGVNTWPELTTEIWCTSEAGKNTGWTMLSYLGGSENGWGKNYTFISIARAVDGSMNALETSVWDGVTGAEYDDGRLHHFVSCINANTIKFYVDGNIIGVDTLTSGNALSSVSTLLAYLGKGGWTADPNWLGTFHKYSLYNKSLTDQEVLFLYLGGAEKDAVINVSTTSVALDTGYPADIFNVTGSNLSSNIAISAPDGITIIPATITKNEKDVPVTVVWDGTTPVNGNITLKSGVSEISIPVKTASDATCFKALYNNTINLTSDYGLNNISSFSGWGTRLIHNIISNPSNVYCGAASAEIGDGLASGTGSLNVDLNGKLNPNTTYRIKAVIKTIGGTFQIGILGWSTAQADTNFVYDTQGEWKTIDTTFTTGASVGDSFGNSLMFFNNWMCTGKNAFIDNWEMYEIMGTGIKNADLRENKVFLRNNQLIAQVKNFNSKNVKAEIYTIHGQLVNSFEIKNNFESEQMIADMTHLNTGVYLVRISSEEQKMTCKIIR